MKTFGFIKSEDESAAPPVVPEPAQVTIDKHPDLAFASRAVRNLAREQKGRISAREAHDAWRWPLVSRGWKLGELDSAAKTHPLMLAFDKLPADRSGHALSYSEGWDAEQDEPDSAADRSGQAVTR